MFNNKHLIRLLSLKKLLTTDITKFFFEKNPIKIVHTIPICNSLLQSKHK